MLRFRSSWLAGGWLLTALVIYLSLVPHPPRPLSFDNADKLEHIFAYASLSLWFCQIYLLTGSRRVVIISLVLLGIALEFVQGWTGYRSCDALDMAANTAGALLGYLLARSRLGRLFLFIETAWQ